MVSIRVVIYQIYERGEGCTVRNNNCYLRIIKIKFSGSEAIGKLHFFSSFFLVRIFFNSAA